MTTSPINRLMIVTVSGEQTSDLIQKLNRDGFYVTVIDSRGGLLDERLSTLLIGLNAARQEPLLEHLRRECRTRRRLIPTQLETPLASAQTLMIEAETGGAVIYLTEIDQFLTLD
ncbi:MAG: cyclic-di-AMP receptor [Anaerolineales bacterium]|nr:cyclic-di-AMP receptor [Anaerolineales bacterium]